MWWCGVHRLSDERWKSLTWCSRNKLSPTAFIAIAIARIFTSALQLYSYSSKSNAPSTREKQCDALWLQMKYNDYCTVRSTRVLVGKKTPDDFLATSHLIPYPSGTLCRYRWIGGHFIPEEPGGSARNRRRTWGSSSPSVGGIPR